MVFREVAVTEIREVLRGWLAGAGLRRVAEQAGVDRKTARRYVAAAQAVGLARGGGIGQLTLPRAPLRTSERRDTGLVVCSADAPAVAVVAGSRVAVVMGARPARVARRVSVVLSGLMGSSRGSPTTPRPDGCCG